MIRVPRVAGSCALSATLLVAFAGRAQTAGDNPYADARATAAPAPGDTATPSAAAPPLRPRFETPSELAADAKRPRFLKPSEIAAQPDGGVAARASTAAAASGAPSSSSSDSDFCAVLARPENRAYFMDSTGSPFARAPCTGAGARVFYVRGFFSYLSNGFDEWSGAELGWQGSLARDFALGALLHHEYREQRSLSLGAWMSARLHGGLHGFIGVTAGNATYYAPVTALDLEIGNRFASLPRSYFAFGAGSARYSQERRYWYADARHAFDLGRGWRGETKLGLGVFDAPSIDVRPEPLAALTAIFASGPGLEWQARAAYTLASGYRVGADPAQTRDHPDVSVAIGAKYWLAPTYGFVAQLQYERLFDSFDRVGADYTVFFAGP